MNNLINIFSTKALVDVLSVLLSNPEQECYQSELVKRTGHALVQIQRALKRLEEAELVIKTQRGRMVYYQANCQHPVFEELRDLFIKTFAVGEPIRQVLQELGDDIQFAFIYGSIAKGEETVESDIDLFIIANVGLKEITKKMAAIRSTLTRELNISLYTLNEFKKKLSQEDYFIREVMNNSKIWLLGDENEFRKL